MDQDDKIKFNNKVIDNEDLTMEAAGIGNKSVILIQNRNSPLSLIEFFSQATIPILLAGLMYGIGHRTSIKFLEFFKDLTKYSKVK